ncbi:putative ribonuclease H-like domain-containing protein [Tanacetum coccineum]
MDRFMMRFLSCGIGLESHLDLFSLMLLTWIYSLSNGCKKCLPVWKVEEMSSMGRAHFFLGLQVKQKEDGIFISQDKYVAEILKKFDICQLKGTASRPIKDTPDTEKEKK